MPHVNTTWAFEPLSTLMYVDNDHFIKSFSDISTVALQINFSWWNSEVKHHYLKKKNRIAIFGNSNIQINTNKNSIDLVFLDNHHF